MLQVHLDVLKEPRGFIKIIQFLLAILAFATTVSFSTTFTFHATVTGCPDQAPSDIVKNVVNYPFALDSSVVEQYLCRNPEVVGIFHFPTDVSTQAKFFVAMGVISMLYAIVALAGYVLLNDTYTSNRVVPTADFVLHAVLVVLWLAAAAAWASGVNTLADGADPENSLPTGCDLMTNVRCTVEGDDQRGGFGKLNASLCFGFLNMFVWFGNLWFIFKETLWYKARPANSPAAAAAPAAPTASA